MRLSFRSVLVAVLSVFAVPTLARADVPGNGEACEMQDGCVQCYNSFSDDDAQATDYDSCIAAAQADGLQLSCSQLQGAGDQEFWCPEGVDANAGCSASAMLPAQGAAFLLSCASAAALAALRRKQRRHA